MHNFVKNFVITFTLYIYSDMKIVVYTCYKAEKHI